MKSGIRQGPPSVRFYGRLDASALVVVIVGATLLSMLMLVPVALFVDRHRSGT